MTDPSLDWQAEVIASMDAGDPLFVACAKVGMSVNTVKAGARRDPDFARRLRMAEGRRSSRLLQKVEAGCEVPGEWKRFAWLAERTTPELREVKEVRQQVELELQGLLDAVEPLMSAGAYQELLDAMDQLAKQPELAAAQAASPRLGQGTGD